MRKSRSGIYLMTTLVTSVTVVMLMVAGIHLAEQDLAAASRSTQEAEAGAPGRELAVARGRQRGGGQYAGAVGKGGPGEYRRVGPQQLG